MERWDIDDIQPWIATPRVNGALKRGAKVAAAAAAGGSGGAGASGHQQQQEQRQHIKPEPGMEPEEYNDEEVGDNSGALNVKMEGGGDEEERENIRAAIIGGGVDVDDVQGQLVLADAEADGGHDWSDLAEQLINLQGRGVAVRWRLELTPTSSSSSSSSGTSNAVGSWLRGEIIINMKDLGERRIHTAFLSKDSASQETYLVQIWLDKILQAMDHLQDSQEFLNRDVERLNVLWDKALDACERQGVETTLEYPQEVNIRMYDRIMMGVENLDRPMLEGIEEECNEKIALKLKPYQKRALSFMMREEKAEGGTARLLWLKVPLPGNPVGVECWMSPSLFQIYISKSPTVTNLALGNTGGGGYVVVCSSSSFIFIFFYYFRFASKTNFDSFFSSSSSDGKRLKWAWARLLSLLLAFCSTLLPPHGEHLVPGKPTLLRTTTPQSLKICPEEAPWSSSPPRWCVNGSWRLRKRWIIQLN